MAKQSQKKSVSAKGLDAPMNTAAEGNGPVGGVQAASERRGIVDRERYKYTKTKTLDPNTGKLKARTGNSDAIATALQDVHSTDQLVQVVKANSLTGKVSEGPGAFANPGQFRMNVGNALRNKVKKGEAVTILTHNVKKLDQKVVSASSKAAEAHLRDRSKADAEKAKAKEKADAEKAKAKAAREAAKTAKATAAANGPGAAKGKDAPANTAAEGGKAQRGSKTPKAAGSTATA